MAIPNRLCVALLAGGLFVVATVAATAAAAPAGTAHAPPRAAQCGSVPPGNLLTDPRVVDLDEPGVSPLVFRVVQNGYKYCYLYTYHGITYIGAPTLRVHELQPFAIQIIDELPQTARAGMSMKRSARAAGGPNDPCPFMQMTPPAAVPMAGYFQNVRDGSAVPPPDGDTNLHTHGLHVLPTEDNVLASVAQSTARTPDGYPVCQYSYSGIPAEQSPGTYWYHSHMHGASNAQVGGGLAGALIVEAPGAAPPPATLERVIVIKDFGTPTPFRLTRRFELARHATRVNDVPPTGPPIPMPSPWTPFSPPPYYSGMQVPAGTPSCPPPGPPAAQLSVNDLPVDNAPTPIAALRVDVPQIWRVVNASAGTYVNLRLADKTDTTFQSLSVLALDGYDIVNTNRTAALVVPQIVVPPAGRADIFMIGRLGEQHLVADTVCTGYTGDSVPRRDLVRIVPLPPAASTSRTRSATRPPAALRGLRKPRAARPDETRAARLLARIRKGLVPLGASRAITFTEYDTPTANTPLYVTDTTTPTFAEHPFSIRPGSPYPVADITVQAGTVENWTLINATPEMHAFHIHQLTFVAVDDPFDPPNTMLDTAALPSGAIPAFDYGYPTLVPSTVHVWMDFTNATAGAFVFHCHMLGHEDAGMMGIIRVVGARQPAVDRDRLSVHV